MAQKSNRGGLRNPPGGRPSNPEVIYKQVPLKLPPDLIEWLAANVENRNGFIVEAIREKIGRGSEAKQAAARANGRKGGRPRKV